MRYNPNAYVDYPILRPHSSDYPKGHISTRLVQTREDNNLRIRLEFEIDEPTILKQIEKGDATCCAFLYCSNTCYSEMLRADQGSTAISSLTPLSRLKGRVELNPSVIAVDDPCAKDRHGPFGIQARIYACAGPQATGNG